MSELPPCWNFFLNPHFTCFENTVLIFRTASYIHQWLEIPYFTFLINIHDNSILLIFPFKLLKCNSYPLSQNWTLSRIKASSWNTTAVKTYSRTKGLYGLTVWYTSEKSINQVSCLVTHPCSDHWDFTDKKMEIHICIFSMISQSTLLTSQV